MSKPLLRSTSNRYCRIWVWSRCMPDQAVTARTGTKLTLAEPASAESFKPFVQAVGRGVKLRRDLTLEESAQAMRMILRGEATQAQIGAFLIAQRVKGEAEAEIRGFT